MTGVSPDVPASRRWLGLALAQEGDATAGSVAGVLTSLASDLKSCDGAPTRAQRQLLASQVELLAPGQGS